MADFNANESSWQFDYHPTHRLRVAPSPSRPSKAMEAMRSFQKMDQLVSRAIRQLEQRKDQNAFAYATGMIKLVDLYNEYGNYRKADSLLNLLKRMISYYSF